MRPATVPLHRRHNSRGCASSRPVGETDSAVARIRPRRANRLKQPQPFDETGDEFTILGAENVDDEAHLEPGARRDALKSTGVGLAGNPVDGVLALHLGEFVVQVLAHLRGDGIEIEGRIIDGEPRRGGVRRIDMIARGSLHAARVASEQETDLVAGLVGLMDADFLAAAAGEEDEVRGRDRAGGVLEQRTDLAPDGTTRDVGAAEGILNNGVIGAAQVEGAFPGSDMESGLADHFAIKQEFSDEANFGAGGM